MKDKAYPHLFTPIRIGNIRLNNRIVMGSMHTGLEEMRGGYRKLAAFYAERVRGGVELIVTGGISPNFRGRLALLASQLSWRFQLGKHRFLTDAVHDAGGYICLQILHAGRYAMHPFAVSASAVRAPISPFTPKALSTRAVRRTIDDFIHTAELAKQGGYDGVEIMGSEGYLINQFICEHSNQRQDEWGGSFENRSRIAIEIVDGIRRKLGEDFLIIFRLSMLDLLEKGSRWQEVVQLAKAIEQAGASVINTGIGWHEVRIPTIAATVPRAAFSWVTEQLQQKVQIPLITSNRINTPHVAEQVLAHGQADMVSMARPMLADADFVNKAKQDKAENINTCIACNQGCLDRVFQHKRATCLVNPFACYETELVIKPATDAKHIVVVGLGPAGLACATLAAQRGHRVSAYDAADIGGQFNLACRIPGKEEFNETLRYYRQRLEQTGVELHIHTRVNADTINASGADIVILATGVIPRTPELPGIDNAKVLNYMQYIRGEKTIGDKVAIMGAGGIGFDVASKLVHDSRHSHDWYKEWGVDKNLDHAGGLERPVYPELSRHIMLLQRKSDKMGKSLGKSTGWIHRLHLRHAGVEMLAGVQYIKMDDAGLHIRYQGRDRVLDVDNIITCTGQLSNRDLLDELQGLDYDVHVIGGADRAAELDAESAIRQGTELALSL